MANPHCIGIWRRSTLTPTNSPPEDDGRIMVTVDVSGNLTGRHEITGASLIHTTCDGQTISFTRITANESVSYSGEINSEDPLLDKVKGRFERQKTTFDEAFREARLLESGDWTAEKPT